MFRRFWETSFLIPASRACPSPAGYPSNSIWRHVLSQPSLFLAYLLTSPRILTLASRYWFGFVFWSCTVHYQLALYRSHLQPPVSGILCLMAPTMMCPWITNCQLLSVREFCGMNHDISELEMPVKLMIFWALAAISLAHILLEVQLLCRTRVSAFRLAFIFFWPE